MKTSNYYFLTSGRRLGRLSWGNRVSFEGLLAEAVIKDETVKRKEDKRKYGERTVASKQDEIQAILDARRHFYHEHPEKAV